jgi:hypothetical protein
MQTTKARAQYLRVHDGPMWKITHPGTPAAIWAKLPRDGAARLIERFVVPAQAASRRKRSAAFQ